ncbi:MAG: type VI secretion system baseplate subunit TssG [Granulosicoccus sp.]
MSEGIERLVSALDDFDFISCLRLVECERTDRPRVGKATRPSDEVIRLSQKASTGFKGRALDSIEERKGHHEYQLFCNFFGLFGTNGPLPLHLTEYADQRVRHHQDPTFAAFVDMFNHRMLSLLYRASAELDPAINFDRPDDNALEPIIAAFGGYLPSAARQRDTIPDYEKFSNAAWMGRYTKSPDGIVALIEQYFSLCAKVEEFTGDWLTLPDSAQTVIGRRSQIASLGVSTYLGKRAWSVGHKFTIILGPLLWNEYQSFKPGGLRARELYQLMKNYVGDEWDWDVRLVIAEGNVCGFSLNRQAALGFNSFLGGKTHAVGSTREVCINKSVLNR